MRSHILLSESIGLELNFSKSELYFLGKPNSDIFVKFNCIVPDIKLLHITVFSNK